jgi:CRP-like cAMP-binding protein
MNKPLELKVLKYKKDSFIIVEGNQKADRFFIIKEGSVKISMKDENDEILKSGNYFGVISTMSSHYYIETAQALTDAVIITVLRSQFEEFIQKKPDAAIKIIVYFSNKLRDLNKTLARLTLKNTNQAGHSQLFNVGQHYLIKKHLNIALDVFSRYVEFYPEEKNAQQAKKLLAKINTIYTKPALKQNNNIKRTYNAGEMLFAEGEPGNEIFFIQSGSVRIIKIVDHKEVLLAVLKAGDIVGEMALLENKPRDASAIVYEKCEVMAINKANFELMIKTRTQLAVKIMVLISERLWLIYKQLANAKLTNIKARMYDALIIQLEKNKVNLGSMKHYIFDFGEIDLLNMVGLNNHHGYEVLKDLMKEKKIIVKGGKICTPSVFGLFGMANYYKKLESY